MIAILILVFILFVIPFILVIINVFKDQADITANPLALVGEHGFTFKNFPDAMKKMDFFNVFKNSLIITTCATILTILVSAMASFVIVRNGKWKACAILFALMIASMVIPFQVLMVPLVDPLRADDRIDGHPVPGPDGTVGFSLRRSVRHSEQPDYTDIDARRILSLHGDIYVPRGYSFQYTA